MTSTSLILSDAHDVDVQAIQNQGTRENRNNFIKRCHISDISVGRGQLNRYLSKLIRSNFPLDLKPLWDHARTAKSKTFGTLLIVSPYYGTVASWLHQQKLADKTQPETVYRALSLLLNDFVYYANTGKTAFSDAPFKKQPYTNIIWTMHALEKSIYSKNRTFDLIFINRSLKPRDWISEIN